MNHAIDELRALRTEADAVALRKGMAAGHTWATEHASVCELRHIDELRTRCGENWVRWFTSDRDDAFTVAELFAREALDDPLADRSELENFWVRAIGFEHTEHTCEDAFVRGFADGALEVWDEVKDQL